MTRLEAARREYRAAIVAELDALTAELSTLGADDAPKPPPRVKAPRTGKKKMSLSERARAGAKARWGKKKPEELKKAGEDACDGCGREDVGKSPGPGGFMRFHRAPDCELVCASVNLDRVDAEERQQGVHSRKNCPKCKAA